MRILGETGSISTKLARMNLLVGATALLLACVSFLVYEVVSFRHDLIASLSTEAQIIGSNTVSALLYNDPQAAESTLLALRGSQRVLAARVFTTTNEPFASYSREPGMAESITPWLQPGQETARWRKNRNMLLGRQIMFQGHAVGSVYILADTTEVVVRARNYLLISVVILILCLFISFLVTSRLRQQLADPMIELASTAGIVTSSRDYSIRAARVDDMDELSTLVDSFNEMLGQIEKRDTALQEAKEDLERKVQSRTAELSETNQELEAFSYTVAHDLRDPLEAIGNISYLLQHSSDTTPGDTRRLYRQLQDSVTRMSSLIEDLLNLSRSNRGELQVQSVDLSDMAFEIAAGLRNSDPARKVIIRITPHLQGIADRRLMQVVLENLLRNAWKYSSRVDPAIIEFGTLQADGDCVYFVRDNGAGFDPAKVNKLFKPFQRLHSDRDFPGTGIGLATVQRIIGRHGGRVWAEGAPNRGAAFYFTLARQAGHLPGDTTPHQREDGAA